MGIIKLRRKERCKNCKFWKKGNAGWEVEGTGWGICELGDGGLGNRSNKESKAYAKDVEDYAADLITHQTFGCIQFEDEVSGPTSPRTDGASTIGTGR